MNPQSIIACFAFYFLLSLAVVSLVRGDEQSPDRPQVPAGETSAISDWALAGVVWSDASLTKKLVLAAASETDDPARFEELQGIARQTHRTIELMEEFGWRQVERTAPAVTPQASRPQTGSTAANSTADADAPLPSPAQVGQQVAQSLDTSADRSQSPQRPAAAVTRELATPPGGGDPGLAEPLRESPVQRGPADLSPYRVEDKMDVIPGQPRMRGEAIRDGVQQAIAAEVGPGGLDGGVGRISKRRVMSGPHSLPYSIGSIYSTDDYDPSLDYNINHPREMFSVIEGEDNLITELARERRRLPPARDLRRQTDVALLEEAGRRTEIPSIVEDADSVPRVAREAPGSVEPVPRPTAIQRFTTVDGQLQADANWLQFHLDTNQLRWRQLINQPLTPEAVDDAVNWLQIHAELAYQATSDERLRQALLPWVTLSR